ncbi:uncharacterized protein LOC130175227 [Seriola aureovittata]|uniref:uncharacterized protein LOC130175227 n=1 Tax=Seriola aureovittata TaxID=2871759 RepID=UPI0024BE34A8|nr:uncharacterized protein LOC130175227 [Seriola aureovittata]
MVEFLGQPEDHQLRAGIYTQYYFSEEEAAGIPTWRLMTPEEYTAANNVKPEERHTFIALPSSLDDLVNIYPEREAAEFEDRRAFVDFMKMLLHLDGDQRISPCQALQQSFITMTHLTGYIENRAYLTTSQIMMSICPMEDSNRVNTCGSKGEATRSFDGTKATVSYDDGPFTGSSDGVPVASSNEEDPPVWYSDGELYSLTNDEDPDAWISDGELYSLAHDEDPAAWISDGELHSLAHDEDPAAWSSDGGLDSLSRDEDPAAWSSDGGLDSLARDEDPAACSSNGAKPTDSTATASSSSGHPKKLLQRISRFFSRITAPFSCWGSVVED